jgi:hypothetical protein
MRCVAFAMRCVAPCSDAAGIAFRCEILHELSDSGRKRRAGAGPEAGQKANIDQVEFPSTRV